MTRRPKDSQPHPGGKQGRTVFFVDVSYSLDCLTCGTSSFLVASRHQAKKVIRYIRRRCLKFHYAKIQPAFQHDLHGTSWKIERRFASAGVATAMTAVNLSRIDPARNMCRFYRLDSSESVSARCCETRTEEGSVGPGSVPGSRSTSIRPLTSGNWTHRDPIDLSTKRQRIAELARTETRWASHLRDFLDRRVTDGVSYTTASETLT
jgi:hypothetical protein